MDGWGIQTSSSASQSPLPGLVGDAAVEEELDRSDLLRIALYELNTTIAPRRARLAAIRTAIAEFNHSDERMHDEEIDAQADRILFQKLAFAYSIVGGSGGGGDVNGSGNDDYGGESADDGGSNSDADAAEEELMLLCSALEMVYRGASRTMVALSFAEVGLAMMPLLLDMIGDPNPPEPPQLLEEDELQLPQQEEEDERRQMEMEEPEGGQVRDEAGEGEGKDESASNLDKAAAASAAAGDESQSGASGTTAGSSSSATPKMGGGGTKVQQQQQVQKLHPPQTDASESAGDLSIQIRDLDLDGGSNNINSDDDGRGEEKKADSSVDLSAIASATLVLEQQQQQQQQQQQAGGETWMQQQQQRQQQQLERQQMQRQQLEQQRRQLAVVDDGTNISAQDIANDEEEEEEDDDMEGEDGLYVGWKRADELSQSTGGSGAGQGAGQGQSKRKGQVRFWDDQSQSQASAAASSSQHSNARQQRQHADESDGERDSNLRSSPRFVAAVSKLLKVLRYYSRVLSAMAPMAHQPGLLDALIYQMMSRKAPLAPAPADLSSSIRIDAIATVVNLACAEENKTMMVQHPGLLDAIMRTANEDASEEAREHAAIVLMNVAYAEENKVYMVSQDRLLDTLANLLDDESPFTRRYASASVFTLACVSANTARIARHREGLILDALSRVLLEDPVDEARINSAEACFHMAKNNAGNAADDTVELMGNHPDLLAALAHAVMADHSADVRAYAAQTLEWLAADIHRGMPCHGVLLGALTKASLWTKTTCIAEALQAQAMVAENRPAMIRQDGLLDALASLALLEGMNDEEVRNASVATIVELTKEESLRKVMAKNEGVMTALTRATFLNHGGVSGGGGLGFDGINDSGLDVAFNSKTAGPTSATKIALKNLANAL